MVEPRTGDGAEPTAALASGPSPATPRDREALTLDALAFRGTERFELVRVLGAGGMGVVFEAFDRERGHRVALKTLRNAAPQALLRFKDEFRLHAGAYHPNLVRLGELVEHGEHWFFTMELVEGVHFLRWIGPPPLGDQAEQRLRDGLRQLTDALLALHAAQRVHRDIKSSNVLVTGEGRVVVVDFGLVADLRRGAAADRAILGTPTAMAPEQLAGAPATAASDWYAVGVLLYQALAGAPPYHGTADEIAAAQRAADPPPPRRLARGVPADLESLCLALLRRDPATRAGGADVLRLLGGDEETRALAAPHFVGRAGELAVMRAAHARARAGQAVSLRVEGESGIGKTELARRFVDEAADAGAAVLAGRCYEHESVPYKAVDGVVDALARRLAEMTPGAVAELVFPGAALLAQTFPVLGGFAGAPASRPAADVDPRVLRADMFAAFRELVRRLARRQDLVLFVDDVHWADDDSRDLLGELLRQPGAPPLLLLSVGRPTAAADRLPATETLALEPLAPAEADALIERLLGRMRAAGDRERISREAGGHPLFIDELVRHRLEAPPDAPAEPLSLEEVLWLRIARLDEPTRRLLALLAVNGQPAGPAVLAAALAADLAAVERSAAQLLGGRLVRRTGARPVERIDVYHDRVRRAVLDHLGDDERRALHALLARAYEAAQPDDAEILAAHWSAAGDPGRAAAYTVKAARRAAAVLAFDRAARLAAAALELLPGGSPMAREMRVELADALAHGGHGFEAARAYLDAAGAHDARPALELKRRAVEQYLRSGHVDEGLAAARSVLEEVGLDVPRTSRRALLSALWLRARVRLRGLGFRRRAAESVGERRLAAIDACWSMAIGLGIVDNVRGAAFQSRHLLLALRAGEPRRVARALALETAYAGTAGGRGIPRAQRIGADALRIAEDVGDPHTIGLALGSAGTAACLAGEWRAARSLLERGETILHGCIGTDWELASARVFSLVACVYLGELRELGRVDEYLHQARAHGDLYAESTLLGRVGWLASLVGDDAAAARARTDEAIRRWSSIGFHSQHRFHFFATASIGLYEGDGAAAHRAILGSWAALRSSFLLRVQMARIEMIDVRARAALASACAAGGASRRALLGAARRDADRLARERTGWATVLATMLRAGLARVEGDAERALGHLAAADQAAVAADMMSYAMVARRRYGELTGGDRGAAIVAATDAWLAARGIARPDRFAALLAPGCRRAGA